MSDHKLIDDESPISSLQWLKLGRLLRLPVSSDKNRTPALTFLAISESGFCDMVVEAMLCAVN